MKRKITIHMSQEFMRAAVHYYLENVVLNGALSVDKVETEGERKINQIDHFNVFVTFPDPA